MKIRSGHITNSSSSSFVVETNSSTKKIALDIVEGLYNQTMTEEYYDGEYRANSLERRNRVIRHFNARENFDLPILISWTCNYETWIYRMSSRKIAISTCNNDPIPSFLIDETISRQGGGADEGHLTPPPDLSFLDLDNLNWTTGRIFNEEWLELPYGQQVPPTIFHKQEQKKEEQEKK